MECLDFAIPFESHPRSASLDHAGTCGDQQTLHIRPRDIPGHRVGENGS